MRVLSLDACLDVDVDEFKFKGSVSVYDYDVVIWSPAASLRSYADYSNLYQGRTSLTETNSAALRRDIARRRTEFQGFLETGRTLIVLTPHDSIVFADTGERTYSGTGRNRQTTRMVTEVDILSALPMKLSRSLGSGTEMAPANEMASQLYRALEDSLAYHSIIDSTEPPLHPLLHVKGTPLVVSGVVTAKGGGRLILLPYIYFDVDDEDVEDDDDEEEDKEEEEEEEEEAEAEAARPTASDDVTRTQHTEEGVEEGEPAGKVLLDWVRSLTSSTEDNPPAWTASLRFPSEATRAAELEEYEKRLAELTTLADELKSEQAKDAQWKRLLYASGNLLEQQVVAAFELFGFEVIEVEPGRTDIRATRDGVNVVVEIKGVGKSAAERHAAQLEKWVAEEAAAGRPSPKGILVVTAWRDLPPHERTEPTFPAQMIGYSEQRGHCLVSGVQLLTMVRTCIADPSRADEIAQTLFTTVGTIDGWGALDEIFFEESDIVVAKGTESDGIPSLVQVVGTGPRPLSHGRS